MLHVFSIIKKKSYENRFKIIVMDFKHKLQKYFLFMFMVFLKLI